MCVQYFINRKWTFIHNKFLKMKDLLLKEDLEDFYFDPNIDVVLYYKDCILNFKEHVLKEPLKNIEKDRLQMHV